MTYLLSIIAIVISLYSIYRSFWNENLNRKSKFIDEAIDINHLTIQYPCLKKVYLEIGDPELNVKNDENPEELNNVERFNEVERLKSFCYKYLNMLDLINIHYSVSRKSRTDENWIQNEIKKESYIGNWLNFYSKAFRKGTLGNEIMTGILNKSEKSGDYNKSFAQFALELINK